MSLAGAKRWTARELTASEAAGKRRDCRREGDYQKAALGTAIYAKRHRVIYPALGLASEAGEVAGKIKKVLCDQSGGSTTSIQKTFAIVAAPT